jgi:hypothetical protein
VRREEAERRALPAEPWRDAAPPCEGYGEEGGGVTDRRVCFGRKRSIHEHEVE